MGKHLDKLPKIDEFKAPWENGDEDAEVDKGKLRTYIYGLLKDKATAQDARDAEAEKVKAAETERDEAKTELEKGGAADLQVELEKERAKTSQVTKRAEEAERVNLARTVAEEAGLSTKQAAFLQGSTEEELKASADSLVETFGITKSAADDEDPENEPTDTIRTTPRRRSTNAGEPAGSAASGSTTNYEQFALDRRSVRF